VRLGRRGELDVVAIVEKREATAESGTENDQPGPEE
jgi:hypothetical protein